LIYVRPGFRKDWKWQVGQFPLKGGGWGGYVVISRDHHAEVQYDTQVVKFALFVVDINSYFLHPGQDE